MSTQKSFSEGEWRQIEARLESLEKRATRGRLVSVVLTLALLASIGMIVYQHLNPVWHGERIVLSGEDGTYRTVIEAGALSLNAQPREEFDGYESRIGLSTKLGNPRMQLSYERGDSSTWIQSYAESGSATTQWGFNEIAQNKDPDDRRRHTAQLTAMGTRARLQLEGNESTVMLHDRDEEITFVPMEEPTEEIDDDDEGATE